MALRPANRAVRLEPPGGGVGYETIHVQPIQGLIGLNSAEAQSNGAVNWQRTD